MTGVVAVLVALVLAASPAVAGAGADQVLAPAGQPSPGEDPEDDAPDAVQCSSAAAVRRDTRLRTGPPVRTPSSRTVQVRRPVPAGFASPVPDGAGVRLRC